MRDPRDFPPGTRVQGRRRSIYLGKATILPNGYGLKDGWSDTLATVYGLRRNWVRLADQTIPPEHLEAVNDFDNWMRAPPPVWRGPATMLANGDALKDGRSDPPGTIGACRHEWAVMRDQAANPEHNAALHNYAAWAASSGENPLLVSGGDEASDQLRSLRRTLEFYHSRFLQFGRSRDLEKVKGVERDLEAAEIFEHHWLR